LSGSAPAAIGPHTPSPPEPFLAALHAEQTAVQALLQHTPSTQKLLEHSLPAPQAAPLACFGRQLLAWQKYPAAHCESFAHRIGQAPLAPLHTKGVQDGLPLAPAASVVHVPGAALHTLQPPSHPFWQQ
jgi:hypothetical protein